MVDRNTFMETLRDVAEIVRTSATPMSREDVMAYFKDMDLSSEQEDMVFTYLSTPHEEEIMPETETEEEKQEEINDEMFDSKVFLMYMEELEGIPDYSEDDKAKMYEALIKGDKEIIKTICNAWLKTVVEMSKACFKKNINIEDVIQEGNMGVFLKVTELCGSGYEGDLEASITKAADEAMRNYISEMTGEEDVEEAIAGKANLIAEAQKYLTKLNGKEPTPEELSEYTHIEREELDDIMNIINTAKK